MEMKTKRLASLLAASGLAVIGGIGLGVAQGDSAVPAVSANTQSRVTDTDSAQARAFGVLRRTQQASDGIATTAKGPFGANLNLARRVMSEAGEVRVVPADDDYLCLRGEDSVGSVWTCTPTAVAANGRLVLSVRTPGEASVPLYGLVPDGVKTVALTDAAGVRKLPVTDNVYGAIADEPTSVEYTDANGTESVQVP